MAITLTERAAAHVKRFMTERDRDCALRVEVKPTGCSGFMYVVKPAKEVGESDQVFESNGVKVVVDPQSLKFLVGTELDYVREGLNEGFKFINPNVKSTCGCGESFSV
ncbi:MAG: HesB/IscA family protein [Gammaproteobacteria bacterium]